MTSTNTGTAQDWLTGTGWVSATGIRPEFIRLGRYFDSSQADVKSAASLHIQQERIESVEALSDFPTDAQVLDLSSYFVVPGLIDAHAHLASIYDKFEPNAYLTIAAADSATLTTHIVTNAQRCLRMGTTCVRDMPGFSNFLNHESIAVREAASRGMLTVPRIVAYGWVEPTAGHMDMGLPTKFRNDPTLYADGPYEVRRMARRMIRDGVDGFKTAVSGGLGGRREEIWWTKYTDEELIALTDTAHGVGKLVAVHAHTDDSVRQGIRCNVDTIEHGVYMKQPTAALLAQKGIPLVPTLAVKSGRALERAMSAGALSPLQLRKRQEMINEQGNVVQIAFNEGVIIATGSDAYFTLRGDYWGLNNEEIKLLADAGMPLNEALKAATYNAAIAIGLAKDIGAIEKGRYADLVAFTRSPLDDPSVLTDPNAVALVMVGGEIVAGSYQGMVDVLRQSHIIPKEVGHA